ncbi:uncharacterized protein LOC100900677 [Galendromus occidentalis]|uniref:Uncharacterized protein LOC100900677 n=1 Tax=Galendromus occidentalis TaxID=34638 RepID=A0AAJ7P999_9ACAR|nr:uncharacterized protein LOC100900677 [Galendromus occidentalis]
MVKCFSNTLKIVRCRILPLLLVVAYAYAQNDLEDDDQDDSPLSLIQQEFGEKPPRRRTEGGPSSLGKQPGGSPSSSSPYGGSSVPEFDPALPSLQSSTAYAEATPPSAQSTSFAGDLDQPTTISPFSAPATTLPPPSSLGLGNESPVQDHRDRLPPDEISRRTDEVKPPGYVDDRNAALLYRHGYSGFRDRSGLLPVDLSFASRLHALLPPVARNDENRAPRPFNFAYISPTEAGGAHSRSEVADAAGRRVGYYTIRQPNGHVRRVNYIADHNGFRAEVLTNEPGTDNQNTAGAIFRSSAALPYPERLSGPGVPASGLPPSSIPVHTPTGGLAHGLPTPLAITPTGLPLSPSDVSRPLNPLRYPTAGDLESRYRFPGGSLFPDLRMRYVRIPDGFRAVLVPLHS